MNYSDKINMIYAKIQNREYDVAKRELENIIRTEKIKMPEDENNTYYCFYNYIEALIYFNKFRPAKKNIQPENNIAEIYYHLGYIEYEMKNYGKAIEYLNKGLEWNPTCIQIIFEKVDVYRSMGEMERYRAEIEKAYQYIYSSPYMAKYYRELGWYYSEKRVFNVANALYTHSMDFFDTELAQNELIYIAQQEQRKPKFSTQEEIKKAFTEYNIPSSVSNSVTQIIFDEYQRLLKESTNLPLVDYLARGLYDITLDKRFMLYVNLKDENIGIEIQIPKVWKVVDRKEFSKFGINEKTIFLFITQQNRIVSLVCDGKCDKEELDNAYRINKENMKKQGFKIINEYTIRGHKNINQVFVDVENENRTIRMCQNYIVKNGYLFNFTWEVRNDIEPIKVKEYIDKEFEMDVLFTIKASNEDTTQQEVMNEINQRLNEWISKGKTMQEAMEIVFGDNQLLRKIKEEYKNNGITKLLVELLGEISVQIIEDGKLDRYWSDEARNMFKLLILSNLVENNDVKMHDLLEQTQSADILKNIISRNINKLNYKELSQIMTVALALNSDKPLKSLNEIIHNAVLTYARTELQKEGANQSNGKNETKTEENIENYLDNKKSEKKEPIIVKCPACNVEFNLKWNVPSTEKTFYCKCPTCNAEIKYANPNFQNKAE